MWTLFLFDSRALPVRVPCGCRALGVRLPFRSGAAKTPKWCAVRKRCWQGGCMTDAPSRTRLVRRRKIRLFQGRTVLYAWLRAHHAKITKLRGSVPCLWAELGLDMTEDGVVDSNGDPPSVDNIRMTWHRLCRDMERPGAGFQAGRAVGSPRESHRTGGPQAVIPPRPIRAPLPAPPSNPQAASPAGQPAESGKSQKRAWRRLDRVFAKLEADDRRKFRFGG